MDFNVRSDAHALEYSEQKLARLFGDVFLSTNVGHVISDYLEL